MQWRMFDTAKDGYQHFTPHIITSKGSGLLVLRACPEARQGPKQGHLVQVGSIPHGVALSVLTGNLLVTGYCQTVHILSTVLITWLAVRRTELCWFTVLSRLILIHCHVE